MKTDSIKKFSEEDIERCIKKDNNALRLFMDIYGVYIMGVMKRILNIDEDVEDCFIHLMERIPNRLKTYDKNLPIKPFLHKMAKNDALNMIKPDKSKITIGRKADSIYDYPHCELEGNMNIEKTIYSAFDVELVKSIIDSFDEDDMLVKAFYMKYIDGFSFKEIAHFFNINVAIAKNRVYRGRDKIRIVLKKQYPDYFK